MSADKKLMGKIRRILKEEFHDACVDVSASGIQDNIHIVVMTRDFDDKTETQKQEYLWSIIDKSDLSEEDKLNISLLLPLSPQDVKP